MTQKHVVGIVGTGLIGGSIGMRSRRDGALVVGYDADAGALAQALEVGAVDLGATRDEVYARAGTVVIAAHVDATIAELKRLQNEGLIRATLVIDVASVKAPIAAVASGLANFVATHPMAGREKCGVRAARADLFDGKTWAYVSSGNGQLDGRARAFIASMGAIARDVDAAEHDRIVALSSHAIQVLAWAYKERAVGIDEEELLALSGTAARELLRLGDSPPGMWREILAANAENVDPHLRAIATSLNSVPARELTLPPGEGNS